MYKSSVFRLLAYAGNRPFKHTSWLEDKAWELRAFSLRRGFIVARAEMCCFSFSGTRDAGKVMKQHREDGEYSRRELQPIATPGLKAVHINHGVTDARGLFSFLFFFRAVMEQVNMKSSMERCHALFLDSLNVYLPYNCPALPAPIPPGLEKMREGNPGK